MAARQQRQEDAAHPDDFMRARQHGSLGECLKVASWMHGQALAETGGEGRGRPPFRAFRDKGP